MSLELTEKTFQVDVIDRSQSVPVVVDLWATWCTPCLTLGPILERVVGATGGRVELVKVNIDQSPRVADIFRVQSIPAVFAIHKGEIVDNFVGALPEKDVQTFVDRLLELEPKGDVELLVEAGDEESLRRALELEPDNAAAIVALAMLWVADGDTGEALALLAKIPETVETRRVAAAARLAAAGKSSEVAATGDGIEARIEQLLGRVREDDEARQELVDILETMDPEDPRRGRYRRALASRLF